MAYAQLLPPTRPTTLPSVTSTPPQSTINPPSRAALPATVTYADGKLQITAADSSLNQILREISRQTGMTITGGVAEQRVFGAYGPASPAAVLGDLLQGTGSNMLLRETSSSAPAQLILSPRQGGVTPPNPNAPGFDSDLRNQETSSPLLVDQPSPNSAVVPPAPRPPYVPPTGSSPDNSPPAAPASSITPPAPSGPLTPEQVYQQLQLLQKAQPHP